MLTSKVQTKLAIDYGIRAIPHELLMYFVQCANVIWPDDAATIAFVIATKWQRGMIVAPVRK